MGIITLTTDFGTYDPYVAAMKGVLRRLCPDAVVDDLSHEIAPHDITEAMFFLEGAVPWYPLGAVHVVVVDPGVGTQRRPIALSTGGIILVGPDNGVFSVFLAASGADWTYAINPAAFGASEVSDTFHGRDIFAPAAAWLANGGEPARLGAPVTDPVMLHLPETVWQNDAPAVGCVVHIDRFGNCITNIRRRNESQAASSLRIGIGGHTLPLCRTYGDVLPGRPLALYGSGGRLEIAVNQGNAARLLGISRTDSVNLIC